MRHVWKVRIEYQEDIEGDTFEDFFIFYVEAPEDITARKTAVRLAMRDASEDIKVLYAEVSHVTRIDE